MIHVSDIDATDWSMKLGSIGEIVTDIEDIHQCIGTIIGTIKGSVPHNPLFGCDAWKYQDSPIDYAIPNVCREIRAALEQWEQRIEVKTVAFIDFDDARARIRIQWVLADGTAELYSTEVPYVTSA